MKKFLGVCFVFLLVSCAHTPIPEPEGYRPDSFWQEQSHREKEFEKFLGKFKLSYEGAGESVSGKSRVLMQMPNLLRLETRDPLGRVQYLAVLKDQQFLAYYPSEKIAYLDSEGGRLYLSRFLGRAMPFFELQRLLVGLLPTVSKSKNFSQWQWDSKLGVYQALLSTGNRTYSLKIDPQSSTLVSISFEVGDQPVDVTYEDRKSCCKGFGESLVLAHSAQLTTPKSKVEVNWEEIRPQYRMVTEPFRYQLPDDVRKVFLKKEGS